MISKNISFNNFALASSTSLLKATIPPKIDTGSVS